MGKKLSLGIFGVFTSLLINLHAKKILILESLPFYKRTASSATVPKNRKPTGATTNSYTPFKVTTTCSSFRISLTS
jgi:hypothetical protein